MKTLLLFLNIFLTFGFTSFSQKVNYVESYHKVRYLGDLKVLQKDYDSALYYYQSAFSNVPYGFCFDYLSGSWVAYKAGKTEIARAYLDSAVLRGLYIQKIPKKYFESKKDWLYYKTNIYPDLYIQGQKRLDTNMIHIIDSLYKIDQGIRKFNMNDKEEVAEFIKLAPIIDSINAVELKKHIALGNLGEEELGSEGYKKLKTMIFHKLLEDTTIIYNLYSEGKIERRDYYYAMVRPALQFGEDTKYLYFDKKKNENNPTLDKKRLADGLPTIDTEKKLKKIKNSLYYPI